MAFGRLSPSHKSQWFRERPTDLFVHLIIVITRNAQKCSICFTRSGSSPGMGCSSRTKQFTEICHTRNLINKNEIIAMLALLATSTLSFYGFHRAFVPVVLMPHSVVCQSQSQWQDWKIKFQHNLCLSHGTSQAHAFDARMLRQSRQMASIKFNKNSFLFQ